jgi:hypothetical protein
VGFATAAYNPDIQAIEEMVLYHTCRPALDPTTEARRTAASDPRRQGVEATEGFPNERARDFRAPIRPCATGR